MSLNIARVRNSLRKVDNYLRENSKRPGSDAIHDLRTHSRRLEIALTASGFASKSKVRRLLRQLARVRRRAGKVRDMDVLTSGAMTILLEGEEDCLVELIEHLGAERKKSVRKLRKMIDDSPQMRRDLKQCAKRLLEDLNAAAVHPAESSTLSATAAGAIPSLSELASPSRLGRGNLHEYRLKVKKLYNVLQLSVPATDPAFVRKLVAVKDAIGEWHDSEALLSIAKDVLQHNACRLVKHIQETGDSKYHHALELSGALRKSYASASVHRPGKS